MALTDKQKLFCQKYLDCRNISLAKVISGMELHFYPGSKYFVYVLVDPRSEELFYIGKGSKDRPFDHIKEARGGNPLNAFKCKRIKEILASGNDVDVLYLDVELEEAEAFKIEYAFIKQIGTKNLTNISGGINKETEKERASYNLSRLKSYESWIAERPNATEFEKELYWKVKATFEEIANHGYVYALELKTAGEKTEVIEKRRM